MIALNYIYLSKKHAGGKDQVGLNLLKGFYENGYGEKIIIFCYEYSRQILESLAPGVKIVCIKSRTKGELARIVDLYYVNTFLIPKLILKYNIEIIYHLSINNGLKKFNVVSIVTPHDIKQISHRKLSENKIDKIPFYKYYIYKLMYYLDFMHADKIIAISEFDKKDISNYYPKFVDKIVKIYNPIVIPKCGNIEEKKEKYIVAINLQFLHKNIITLIKAFELIKDKIEHNLILVGNVPKRVMFLKEYVINHKLEDRIIFTGFLSDEEKLNIMSHASLYVNPSKFEGFGMTVVEAILLKVPTLVSDIEVNREVTKENSEFFFPVDSQQALAKKILYCLKKEISNEKLITYKNILESEYSYINISKKYMELFLMK